MMVFLKYHSQSQLWRHVMWFKLLSLWSKSYGVTIQMKPLQQYFCMVPFVFQYFTKENLGFFLSFDFCHS